jgi:hypothetical protein
MDSTANTNQHYVPQTLLRGFAINGSHEKIRVFDKWSGKEFPTSIRKIGVERGYYDVNGSAEIDATMNDIDHRASTIFQKLRGRKSLAFLNQASRNILAEFTVTQCLRTRGFQERMRHAVETSLRAIIDKAGALPAGWPPEVDPVQARENYLNVISPFVQEFIPYLLDKDLLLFSTDSSCPFIVSDHPVTLNNTLNPGDGIRGTLGFGAPGIEICLPISSELTLAYLCPSIGERNVRLADQLKMLGGFIREDIFYFLQSRDTGMALRLSPENVRFQNSLQIVEAERFLFSSISNFEDAVSNISENSDARHGRRVVVM